MSYSAQVFCPLTHAKQRKRRLCSCSTVFTNPQFDLPLRQPTFFIALRPLIDRPFDSIRFAKHPVSTRLISYEIHRLCKTNMVTPSRTAGGVSRAPPVSEARGACKTRRRRSEPRSGYCEGTRDGTISATAIINNNNYNNIETGVCPMITISRHIKIIITY